MSIKPDRKLASFVTPEGIGGFLALFPGQTKDSYGKRAYSVEWSGDITPDSQIVKAASYVAQLYDKDNWQRHVFGPMGRLQKLEEKVKRDHKKYEYAWGKYVIDFSRVCSPASLRLDKDMDITQPANREIYTKALNAAAPLAHKFANVADASDMARIHTLNQERLIKGLPQYTEDQYHKVMLPLQPQEIWPGCKIRVSGYFYWNTNAFPGTLGIGLEHVLFVAEGPRLAGGESSPDAAFSSFAPAAELAPMADNPFASLI